MSASELPTAGAPVDSDDVQLFAILDAYVELLQSGCKEAPPIELPEDLPERYPELAGILDCLDSLEAARNCWTAKTVANAPAEEEVSPSDSRAAVGTRFGPYELLKEIGRGGMGVVYRARHKALQADLAVKVIRGSQLASADEVRRFYQEARVAAGLDHANLVRVHDVGECEGQHYLAMDLVEGPSLAALIADGRPLEPARAAEILVDVARAVHYLHERGIIHRDLKPSNVLLDGSGRPRLADFGLIKLLAGEHPQTVSGTIIGTPGYMAPEQARGRISEVTPLSDVYSLGALLYELLTGRPPFEGGNPLDTLLNVLEREPALPRQVNPAVPRELEAICVRCLEKNPERRYPTAAAVAADLECFLKGEPLSASTSRLPHRILRWFRREPALAWRWTGLAAGAVVVHVNHMLATVAEPNYGTVMSVLAAWAALSLVLQRLQSSARLGTAAPFFWALLDIVAFTGLVCLAEGPRGVLLAGYPLLVVASGLWFRAELVGCVTLGSLLACAMLWLTGRIHPQVPPHYGGILAAILLVCGGIAAYQAHRFRALNRYFDRQSERTQSAP